MSLRGRFLKPGETTDTPEPRSAPVTTALKPHAEDRSDIEPNSTTAFVFNPNRNLGLQAQRQRLPVFAARNGLLYLAEKFQTVIVVGETGSGKSTQIPQYLREAGWTKDGMIAVSEPRRVACTTLAERVAEECDVILGREVGYAIRFDDMTTPGVTEIKFMTEGLLVREMMADPLLRQYCVILIDEVHERTLYTDILLGLLKKVQRRRKDLRIIVSSATVDADQLFRFFNRNDTADRSKDTAAVMSVAGRSYPVDVLYLEEPTPDYVRASVDTVLKIHRSEGPGGVLVFLTGVEEVERCVSTLKEETANLKEQGKLKLQVVPLHGSLHNNDQLQAFLTPPAGVRKVVVATNLAETSITLPGVVYVVDCGFVKLRWFSGQTDALVVVTTSKASATQRAGRAGRVRSGKVYRLYTEEEYNKLSTVTPPEMVRINLSSAVLNLMALGIDNMLRFDFPSPPPASHLVAALDELYALGAIGAAGELTKPLGQNMAELPLPPPLAKMLLVSGEFGCSEEVLSIIAMLQVQSVFLEPRGQRQTARVQHRNFQVEEGDTITLLNVFKSYVRSGQNSKWCGKFFLNTRALRRAAEIRGRMEKLLVQCDVPLVTCRGDVKAVCRCITAGLFPNAAFLHPSGSYRSVRGGGGGADSPSLHIHPSSTLYTQIQPQWVLYNEVLHTGQAYMRDLTVIDPAWLTELAPHYYEKATIRDL